MFNDVWRVYYNLIVDMIIGFLFFIPYIGLVVIPNNLDFIIKSLKILGLILLFIIIHSMCHGENNIER